MFLNVVIDEIARVCSVEDTDYTICAGDFNTDFTRLTSLHTRALNAFTANENFCTLNSLQTYDVPFTFESKANGARSTLDHFFVSPNLLDQVRSVSVSFSINNTSDHFPVHACFEIDTGHRSQPRCNLPK